MRRLSWDSPWWATALVCGGLFGTFEAVFSLVSGHGGAVRAVATGVASGVVFGLLMALFTTRVMRRLRRSVGDVPYGDQKAVSRAASRGPVPADPAIREAALRLAIFRAQENHRRRFFNLSVLAAFIALTLFLSIAEGAWWLLGLALSAGVAVWAVLVQRQLLRRIEVLRDAGPPARDPVSVLW